MSKANGYPLATEFDAGDTALGIQNGSMAQFPFNLVIPDQTNNAGKFLTTDGDVTSWATAGTAVHADGVLSVSATNGSNTTGARSRLDLPYKTIGAAVTAASAGDTVLVYPGTYVENVALSKAINLHLFAGVTIAPATGVAVAITALANVFGEGLIVSNTVAAITCDPVGTGDVVIEADTIRGNGCHALTFSDANFGDGWNVLRVRQGRVTGGSAPAVVQFSCIFSRTLRVIGGWFEATDAHCFDLVGTANAVLGVVLERATMDPGGDSFSVNATNAQTCWNYGSVASQTKSDNVTVKVQDILYSPDVL